MTQQAWLQEVLDILTFTGWRTSQASVNVTVDGAQCTARVIGADGLERSVKLSCNAFTTPTTRATEVCRRLGIGADKPAL